VSYISHIIKTVPQFSVYSHSDNNESKVIRILAFLCNALLVLCLSFCPYSLVALNCDRRNMLIKRFIRHSTATPLLAKKQLRNVQSLKPWILIIILLKSIIRKCTRQSFMTIHTAIRVHRHFDRKYVTCMSMTKIICRLLHDLGCKRNRVLHAHFTNP